jgi:hypothetical protein
MNLFGINSPFAVSFGWLFIIAAIVVLIVSLGVLIRDRRRVVAARKRARLVHSVRNHPAGRGL